MPLSDNERQTRFRTKQKATIAKLLEELAQRAQPDDRETRELKAKVVQLETDKAQLKTENLRLIVELNKKPKAARSKPTPRMDRATFVKIVRALHPDGRQGRTAAELDDACKALNSWWGTQG
jgi:hypothetical protein